MITFAPLAATLHRKQISKTELQKGIKTSSATIAKISKDEYVSMKILDDICNYLDCEITEVISHLKEKDSQ
ncbi:XRE family transcriptional regulator [Fictibacillus phosphorivorans]|uniref:XRE family transcriptional regulator n=1 Tax=Fictibacillus phosphorivorans TaxID=1221500 RepID=A0A160IMG7_9BACL|nr:helix-turn-helix transcriptional regulator [Fictibacillus phosphorivorans]ANC77156.1 XRE family transcriptional regulator [Fictibacillus phosphorivorans]